MALETSLLKAIFPLLLVSFSLETKISQKSYFLVWPVIF